LALVPGAWDAIRLAVRGCPQEAQEAEMKLAEVVRQDAEIVYAATEDLFRRVPSDALEWKPASGTNWMTVAQLLMHCTNACGMGIKGFLTGDWGLPEGVRFEDMRPEDMLPPASGMPSVGSVDEALRLLSEDRDLARKQLEGVGDSRLLGERSPAPWGGPEVTLFQHLESMVVHLGQHKGQLFYYLKLMGQEVDTGDLWGM
jgi:uncharacterized damage-inducible protein DinB